VNTQDSSEFNTWTQVPKHHLVKNKTAVKSLKKSAILNYNHFETLYNLQRSMDNIHQKWKKDHIVHQRSPKIIQRMASASNKEILFNNDNEQLKKISVIVNGLTSYSDIVLINNNENSQYKSIP
jgi:hypothetical protein